MKYAVKQLAFVSGVVLSLGFSVPSMAQVGHTQTETLMNRVNQLDNQMQTLNRYIFQQNPDLAATIDSSKTAVSGSANTQAAVSVFEGRLSEMEQQIRSLTNEIERLQFEGRQLTQKNMLLESRLQALLEKQKSDAKEQMKAQTVASDVSTKPTADPKPLVKETKVDKAQPVVANNLSTGNVTQDYDAAFSFVQSKDYDKAEEAFKDFIKNHGNDDLVHNARYWLGETYYVRGDFDKASIAFAEAFKEAPKGVKAADNLLKLAMSLGRVSKVNEACVTLKELKNRFPQAPASLMQRAKQQVEKYSCDE